MKNYGRSAVSEFLDDRIVFRNLIPADPRLPSLDALRGEAGLPDDLTPRKNDPEYAWVVAGLLRRARWMDSPGTAIRRLVYLGDTRLSDGSAFTNLCQAGGWCGAVFICSEAAKSPASLETVAVASGQALFLANRWSMLSDLDRELAAQGCAVDEATAVVIDLDKTAIGARGRNAAVIDQARVEAVRETVAELLGAAFDLGSFQAAYDQLNQVEFHPFTADNQDYLAYICLILGSGLHDLPEVIESVRGGKLASFAQFIAGVDARRSMLPPGLQAIHEEIYARVQEGDPTPFKAFRRNEYQATIGRMGRMGDDTPVDTLLAYEIVITQEV
ncbi:MAG TPA: hypothetical protein VF498_09665, partial [Anaerolineales bacterium]